MGYPIRQMIKKEFLWDFGVQGGTVGTLSLSAKDFGGNTFSAGFVIDRVDVIVETAVTSGGTPTITIGNTGDTDGYMADIWAEVQAVGVVRNGEVAGALVWDDTNDHEIPYYVNATANNQDVVMVIGTAALTAGKMRVVFHGYRIS